MGREDTVTLKDGLAPLPHSTAAHLVLPGCPISSLLLEQGWQGPWRPNATHPQENSGILVPVSWLASGEGAPAKSQWELQVLSTRPDAQPTPGPSVRLGLGHCGGPATKVCMCASAFTGVSLVLVPLCCSTSSGTCEDSQELNQHPQGHPAPCQVSPVTGKMGLGTSWP